MYGAERNSRVIVSLLASDVFFFVLSFGLTKWGRPYMSNGDPLFLFLFFLTPSNKLT